LAALTLVALGLVSAWGNKAVAQLGQCNEASGTGCPVYGARAVNPPLMGGQNCATSVNGQYDMEKCVLVHALQHTDFITNGEQETVDPRVLYYCGPNSTNPYGTISCGTYSIRFVGDTNYTVVSGCGQPGLKKCSNL
jgi:hypothetical protein